MSIKEITWRDVWSAACTYFTTKGLEALKASLEGGGKDIVQQLTVLPSSYRLFGKLLPEKACPIAYCGWQGGIGIEVVDELEMFFAQICFDLETVFNEPCVIRYFLKWFDNAPREEAIKLLLAEVVDELHKRKMKEGEGMAVS